MKIENEKLKPIIDSMEREYRQNMLTILERFYRGRGGSLLTKDEREALYYAISSIKTDLKYDLLYEETKHIADTDKMIEPTTKNDLGVELISREDVLQILLDYDYANENALVLKDIKALPSVTPQEPKEITLEDVKGYCKPRCLTIISNELLYELTHPKIKAPEQEPVLDKIRAEIESMDFDFGDYYDHTNEIIEMVCKAIDKYKKEERAKE